MSPTLAGLHCRSVLTYVLACLQPYTINFFFFFFFFCVIEFSNEYKVINLQLKFGNYTYKTMMGRKDKNSHTGRVPSTAAVFPTGLPQQVSINFKCAFKYFLKIECPRALGEGHC